ncbi:MAG: DNA polymerase III subunit gamma/tau, partial [Ktedonobacterales bacterium]|nr:DNA polymerase III subunit gamma/tau [Ktedonobacterales bacterium]
MTGQAQSLYRKWRSQTFSDLVGQEAVIQTLRQAVAQARLTHAYLFSGPRGTGKTSTARLLAKMVNCTNPRDGEPCNTCLSCSEITDGRSTDVFEIDAASNRGIDEIRELRDRVRVVSAIGRTRLFIIDEVHMLTTEAFNALLKTLEEPPPNVLFVLATTEAHKIPATVISRCQRFEFRRIALRDIIARLQYVSDQEGLRTEPHALELIARAAQGGMRDALSLLDQARAFAGDAISAEAARSMLGMADPALVRGVIEFVAAGDTAGGLHRINHLAQSGIDLRQLANQLAELWRQLMLTRAGA